MENKKNMYFAVAYKLYTNENGTETMVEEATAEKPFQFLSGFGLALDDFENTIVALNDEQKNDFDFTLTKQQAYGEHEAERVLNLDKEMFCIDGKLDTDNIYKDAIIPLQNENGQRFLGKVLEIGDDKVTVDLNHPLAGKDLHFVGSIVEAREATNEEIQTIINHLSGGGCGGCGGECGGDCNCSGDCGSNNGGCGGCH